MPAGRPRSQYSKPARCRRSRGYRRVSDQTRVSDRRCGWDVRAPRIRSRQDAGAPGDIGEFRIKREFRIVGAVGTSAPPGFEAGKMPALPGISESFGSNASFGSSVRTGRPRSQYSKPAGLRHLSDAGGAHRRCRRSGDRLVDFPGGAFGGVHDGDALFG
jgi:hypothetical protein